MAKSDSRFADLQVANATVIFVLPPERLDGYP